jgi:hypothetical protein
MITKKETKEFAHELEAMTTTLGGYFSKPLVRGWWLALKDRITLDQFKTYVKHAVTNFNTMPMPRDCLSHVLPTVREYEAPEPVADACPCPPEIKKQLEELFANSSKDFDDDN